MQGAPRETADRSDLELVLAAQRGDYAAFEQLVRRYHDKVYRLALSMTKSEADAEEVAQDTFLNIFRSLASFRADSSPGTWIYRVAANSALMRLRTRRRKPLLSLEEIPSSDRTDGLAGSIHAPGAWTQTPDEKLLTREVGGAIDEAVDALPEKYRLVLLLRDVEGLTNEEVATTLGVTVPTVKSRLHRSRMFLRERLEDYFRLQ